MPLVSATSVASMCPPVRGTFPEAVDQLDWMLILTPLMSHIVLSAGIE